MPPTHSIFARVVLTQDFRNGQLGARGMQARHKGRMFWARQAMVDGSEPQTREDFTAEHALRI